MFETFDHTADVGLRIQAPDVDRLFAEAGRALTSLLVDNADDVRAADTVTFTVDGDQTEYLLFDWLNELLFLFETRQMLFAGFCVDVGRAGLKATVRGERADPARHQLAHEVKAITYHGLSVQETEDGWTAEVILDI